MDFVNQIDSIIVAPKAEPKDVAPMDITEAVAMHLQNVSTLTDRRPTKRSKSMDSCDDETSGTDSASSSLNSSCADASYIQSDASFSSDGGVVAALSACSSISADELPAIDSNSSGSESESEPEQPRQPVAAPVPVVVAPEAKPAPALAAMLAKAAARKGNDEFAVVKHEMAPKIESAHLLYPKSWRPPVSHSIWAKQGERECINWLESRGLISSEMMRQALYAVQVYHYTGGVMPYANLPQMVNFSKFAVFWTLWDDVEVEASENAKVQDVINAIRGIPVTGNPDSIHTKYALAFEDLAKEWRYKFMASPEYMERLASGFQLWCEMAILEAKIFRNKQSIADYSFEFYDEMRSITAGCILGVTFVEMYTGYELAPEVYNHANYKRMQTICGALVRYVNDLVSIANDMKDDDSECRWANLIWIDLYLQRRAGNASYSLEDAIARITAMHDAVIAEFERLASTAAEWLPPTVDLPSTQAIFSLMRYYTYGANACQVIIPRYNRIRTMNVAKQTAYMWTLGTEPRP